MSNSKKARKLPLHGGRRKGAGRPRGRTHQRAPMPGTDRARILALHRHGLCPASILKRMTAEKRPTSYSAISRCLERWAA